MKKPGRCFAAVLCALLAVLAVSLVLPSESEAAAGSVRRATTVPRKSAPRRVFASGNGTRKNPYVVRTAVQLSAFAASVNNGEAYSGKYVKLGADIHLNNVNWIPVGYYDENGDSHPFKGFFDGSGFTIYQMSGGALFGALDGATIERVSLQFVQVTGESNVGGLVGFMTESILKNCLVSGAVRGNSAVGGIAGSALKGFMENCNFSGNVVGENGVGGLIGAVDHSTARSCKVTGNVEGNTDVGGFVGGILEGMIIDGVANAVTVHGERNVGGFAGNLIDGGSVDRAAFNGQVLGNSCVGGVVGRMTSGTIIGCSVAGSVKGRAHAGGIAGEFMDREIRRCVSSASVDGIIDIGGVVGRMTGGILNNNANHGIVSGGEAVGGVVGNFSGISMNFSLIENRHTGHVKGYSKTGPLVGVYNE